MPSRARTAPSGRPSAPVTLAEANRRIEELRRRGGVPTRSDVEDLDAPLDPDIRVTLGAAGPARPPSHKVELVLEGESVSWLNVIDFRQQVGSASVRMGGIAGVGTHDAHRFQGHSRRVIENSLRWMRREGYATSMLFGIKSYYPKYGYVVAFPDTGFELATRDAERIADLPRTFPYDDSRHRAAVVRMFTANNVGLSGPVAREPVTWRGFYKGLHFATPARAHVVVDGRERPIAYFVLHDEHLTAVVIEAGYASADAIPAVVRAAAQTAVDQRLEKVRFTLPQDHAITEYCKPLGIRMELTYRPDGQQMVRMIDSALALRNVADDLARRARGAGELSIRTNVDSVRLAWKDGRIEVGRETRGAGRGNAAALMPQWALAQMVYGYRGASSLAAGGTVRATTAAVDALDALFPVRPHFFYPADAF